MKEFKFRVTQTATGFFEGTSTISAKTEKDAMKLLTMLSNEGVEELCSDWSMSDYTEADGEIEIWSDKNKQIR